MPLEHLPYVDEHTAAIAAPAEDVFDAVCDAFGTSLSTPWARAFATVIGCDPASRSGWERSAAVGSTIPGFRVESLRRPTLLVLAGQHRFANYGIVLRVEPAPSGALCRFESRAAFPGLRGRMYRLAVLRSGLHGIAVRRLLREIQRRAERVHARDLTYGPPRSA